MMGLEVGDGRKVMIVAAQSISESVEDEDEGTGEESERP